MLTFLVFIFAGVGITNLMVNAVIFNKIRDFLSQKSPFLGKLFSCMVCSGFWVGVLLWIINPVLFSAFSILAPFCAGGIISLASNFYDIITDYLIYNINTEVIDEINETQD